MASNDNHEKRSLDDTDPNGNLGVVGDPITSCGCGPCKPLWAQFFANPKLFTAHCTAIVTALIISLSYLGGILTTIERQFELSSSESGTLSIINDVVSLSLVLFASYFGHGSHRPRWVASGTILSGIGIFLLAMPHFSSEPLDPTTLLYGKTSKTASVCRSETRTYISESQITVGSVRSVADNNSNPLSLINDTFADECETSSNGLGHIWWFVIGNILIGIGNAPLYPLMTTYIDDAVGKRRLVSYMAFLFISFAIGPSLGLLLSSESTKLYVDFDRVPADQIPDIDQRDPRWIGAWWLGLVACGTLLILLGIPMFFYPKVMVNNLPEDAEGAKEKEKDNKEEEDDIRGAFGGKSIFEKKEGQNGVIDVIKGLMFTMKRLVTNVTLMSMCLAESAETAAVAIFAAFAVKYFQTQFGLSPGTSAMLVGGAILPFNIISNFVSAWIVRHFKLTSRQCALVVIIALSLSGVLLPIMMATGCENPDIAGITVSYNSIEDTKLRTTMSYTTNVNLDSEPFSSVEQEGSPISAPVCNSDCGCSTKVFQPVCGSDEITYISACHAGCLGEDASLSGNGTDKMYVNCSCTTSSQYSSNATAKSGQCPIECESYKLPLFVFLCAAAFFLMALTVNPLLFITLRCVKADDRSVALGLKSLITKVLGFFPSPVYFGAIINSTCIYWQYTCGNRGACWIYDIVKYRYAYCGTLLVLRICSVFCCAITYFSIKPEKSKTASEDKKDVDETLQMKPKPIPV